MFSLLANDNGIVELPAGQFDYPFVFQSPSHLPSSFEHNEAFVRYFAKATMQVGSKCYEMRGILLADATSLL